MQLNETKTPKIHGGKLHFKSDKMAAPVPFASWQVSCLFRRNLKIEFYQLPKGLSGFFGVLIINFKTLSRFHNN